MFAKRYRTIATCVLICLLSLTFAPRGPVAPVGFVGQAYAGQTTNSKGQTSQPATSTSKAVKKKKKPTKTSAKSASTPNNTKRIHVTKLKKIPSWTPKQKVSPIGNTREDEAACAIAPAPVRDAKRPKSSKNIHLNVKAAVLINMSTGQTYYEQNPDKQIAPASITKLLTLYLIREAMAQGKITPDTYIPVSDRAAKTGGSRMKLLKGESVPLSELIKGISVVSANNACVAVAEYMGKGDTSKFVKSMNALAPKLGMKNTVFKNPNGLPAKGQLSTARDIAKLSINYLRAFPESLSIHSMTSYSFNGDSHKNSNNLLGSYAGVDGLKTGFVCTSGFNITATAKRGDTRLLAVVLGAQNPRIRKAETAKLLDYGFAIVDAKKTASKEATYAKLVNTEGGS